jgi:hypothetical protein
VQHSEVSRLEREGESKMKIRTKKNKKKGQRYEMRGGSRAERVVPLLHGI